MKLFFPSTLTSSLTDQREPLVFWKLNGQFFHPLVFFTFCPGTLRVIKYFNILKCKWLCLGLGFWIFILMPCIMPPYMWSHIFHPFMNILSFHIAPPELSLVYLNVTATVQIWSILFFYSPFIYYIPTTASPPLINTHTFLYIFYVFLVTSTSFYVCHCIKPKCYLYLIFWFSMLIVGRNG